jgi:1-acyl-sn-glycerol-3-phosphate acyltransferase
MNLPIQGLFRVAIYLGWTLMLVPLQILIRATRLPIRGVLPKVYHRGCLRIIGIDVEVRGQPATPGPVLFISNHSSYLDISVLGSLLDASFVAKSEVAGWPFFGYLSKLQDTVFIERRVRSEAGQQRDDLQARLAAGSSLILFPEGTSSDGNRTLPFKTALFSVAALDTGGRPLVVQPVSVTATRLSGLPMGRLGRPCYAWYGDMDLVPHLWHAFTAGQMTVEVEFHPPLTPDQWSGRKDLAERCRDAIAGGVSRAIAGR